MNSSIRFECDCGRIFRTPDSNAGRKLKCPDCGESLIVPRHDEREFANVSYGKPIAALPPRRKSKRPSKALEHPEAPPLTWRERMEARAEPWRPYSRPIAGGGWILCGLLYLLAAYGAWLIMQKMMSVHRRLPFEDLPFVLSLIFLLFGVLFLMSACLAFTGGDIRASGIFSLGLGLLGLVVVVLFVGADMFSIARVGKATFSSMASHVLLLLGASGLQLVLIVPGIAAILADRNYD